jgi:hypothetical protein
MHGDNGIYTDARLSFYLLPLFLFGFINTIFLFNGYWRGCLVNQKQIAGVCNRVVYLYPLHGDADLFPVAYDGSIYASISEAAQLSALLDPFGLSAFFMQTANWSVQQRNTALIIPAGAFLFNRIAVLLVSTASIAIAFKYFRFSIRVQKKKRLPTDGSSKTTHTITVFKAVQPTFGWKMH